MQDTIIIGAGIAGMTAALYASRKNMKFLILAKEFGGQFNISGDVLNYPGIIKTTGIEFSTTMQEQMDFNNVKVQTEDVHGIEKTGDNFRVITDKNEYETKSVIIATGARPRKLNVKGEEEFTNKGITYCSICDGPLFKEKDVAVIGGGDAALEAADFMLNIAKKIYILDAAEKSIAHEYLQEKVLNHQKVEYINNAKVTEILGDKFVTSLTYEKDGKTAKLNVQGIIIEIGRDPNIEAFQNLVKLDNHKHIKINCSTETSQKGIFAAGDCASGHEYQYVIAAGQGCMALLKAARYLAKKKP